MLSQHTCCWTYGRAFGLVCERVWDLNPCRVRPDGGGGAVCDNGFNQNGFFKQQRSGSVDHDTNNNFLPQRSFPSLLLAMKTSSSTSYPFLEPSLFFRKGFPCCLSLLRPDPNLLHRLYSLLRTNDATYARDLHSVQASSLLNIFCNVIVSFIVMNLVTPRSNSYDVSSWVFFSMGHHGSSRAG